SPQNVIRGEFSVAGQTDLAVLCSVDRVSTILVFWKMSTDGVAEIAQGPDKDSLQGIGDDKIGYSRLLSTAAPETIRMYRSSIGDPDPAQPEPNHDGIEDAFVEKGSVIRYFRDGTWLSLQGAD